MNNITLSTRAVALQPSVRGPFFHSLHDFTIYKMTFYLKRKIISKKKGLRLKIIEAFFYYL